MNKYTVYRSAGELGEDYGSHDLVTVEYGKDTFPFGWSFAEITFTFILQPIMLALVFGVSDC